jgi:hypothetical protein
MVNELKAKFETVGITPISQINYRRKKTMKTKIPLKANRFTLWPAMCAIGFLINSAYIAHAGVLAYWRMEGQSNVVCTFNGVTDSATASGQGTKTGGCAASGTTNDALITFNDNGNTVSISSTVPPINMFNAGFSGGVGSYNAEAILNKNGALFFPQDQYGDEFSSASWTFEMFIKANGNQSGNGIQSLLKNDENNINYGMTLNESVAGGLRLFIYNGSGFPSVDLTNRNYADGTWHYIVCFYDQPTKKLSIRVRSESDLVSSNSTTLSIDPVVGAAGNLFLGRDTFNTSNPRTFRGLIDEVRISDSVIADGSLIALINANSTNVITSSLNPSTYGSSITVTSTVSAVNTTNGTPTGAVQFKTNGVAMGSAVTLVSGVAMISTAALPAGTTTITAEYGGDGKFYGYTNTLSQVVNKQTPLVATVPTTTAITYGQTLASSTLGTGAVTNAAGATVTGSFAFTTTSIAPNSGTTNVSVTFTPTDTANYNTTAATVTVTINKATTTATLAVNNSPVTYNSSGQAATVSVTASNTPGSVANIVTGGAATQTASGTYSVTADYVPMDTNYTTLTGLSAGSFTINKAGTFVGVSSSENPSGYKDSISFIATLPADAAGNVVFSSNNNSFSTNTVSGVITTSLSITNLPRATNLITVIYSGDGDYSGSTNTLDQVVTNHPPVAGDTTYYRAKGIAFKIIISDLLTNVTDVDGDSFTLTGVGAGTNSATITTNSVKIFYTPSTGASSNYNDSFTYTVSDGHGGSATANINVMVYSPSGPAQMSIPTNNVVNIKFFGIPNFQYVVETTTNLDTPWWPLSTNTAGSDGSWQFTDPNATNDQQYYRSTQP